MGLVLLMIAERAAKSATLLIAALSVAAAWFYLGAVLAAVAVVAVGTPGCSPAQASPGASVAFEVARAAPAVGPAYVDSFSLSCTSAAAVAITPPGQAAGMIAYACQNSSTTKVAVGDSGINDPGGTQNSPIFCATNCPSQEWSADARVEYCRGDTDTTIYCRALVSTSSAP